MMSGHGVATTSTSAIRTGSPDNHHAIPAITSATSVNGTAKRSARRTTREREALASWTSAMIPAYWLSEAIAVARNVMARSPLTTPLSTDSPR